MRPKTILADLPSVYDVKVYIRNAFIKQMGQLSSDIKVIIALYGLIHMRYLVLTSHHILGRSGKGFDDCRWLDC
jgi:hypothetical protein